MHPFRKYPGCVVAECEQCFVDEPGRDTFRVRMELSEHGQGTSVADPPESAHRSLANGAAAVRETFDQQWNRLLGAREPKRSDCERPAPWDPASGGAQDHLDSADFPHPFECLSAFSRGGMSKPLDQDDARDRPFRPAEPADLSAELIRVGGGARAGLGQQPFEVGAEARRSLLPGT